MSTGISANLKDRLRQAEFAPRGEPRHTRRFRMEHARSGADQRRGDEQ